MKVIVPDDHGATDVLLEEPSSVTVRPHRYPSDTYPPLWFYFQVRNDTGRDWPCARIVVEGLTPGQDSYEPFWKHCLWARNGRPFERIPDTAQRFGATTLIVETPLTAEATLWIAETFPLPYAHYMNLRDAMEAPPASGLSVQRCSLGESARGRPLDAFRIQRESRAAGRNLYIVAGQHAVEQSGKIFAETVLRGYHSGAFAGTPMERLLATHNVIVVPLANPDGCYDGRMNTNAEGVVMDDPADNSVETRAVLGLMDEMPPHVLINCHG
ncbi:MAG: M14 family zinc carboxypeptidase, partial [Abditibacteriales bacterium]|nr:M14 family zinc carboxypeptidase [Abditibacteriales bacterium]MDW8365250.1 M14 family zinc carboxypeptidase [Abditibacteriales bacterium]